MRFFKRKARAISRAKFGVHAKLGGTVRFVKDSVNSEALSLLISIYECWNSFMEFTLQLIVHQGRKMSRIFTCSMNTNSLDRYYLAILIIPILKSLSSVPFKETNVAQRILQNWVPKNLVNSDEEECKCNRTVWNNKYNRTINSQSWTPQFLPFSCNRPRVARRCQSIIVWQSVADRIKKSNHGL